MLRLVPLFGLLQSSACGCFWCMLVAVGLSISALCALVVQCRCCKTCSCSCIIVGFCWVYYFFLVIKVSYLPKKIKMTCSIISGLNIFLVLFLGIHLFITSYIIEK